MLKNISKFLTNILKVLDTINIQLLNLGEFRKSSMIHILLPISLQKLKIHLKIFSSIIGAQKKKKSSCLLTH